MLFRYVYICSKIKQNKKRAIQDSGYLFQEAQDETKKGPTGR